MEKSISFFLLFPILLCVFHLFAPCFHSFPLQAKINVVSTHSYLLQQQQFPSTTRSSTFRSSLKMVAADNIHSSKSFTQINNLFAMVGKSTSSLVSLVFFAVLAYQRNATMISFFLGSIANAIAAKVLKRIIRQERPDNNNKNDKGMPSSHSMSLGFIGTFAYLGWGRINRHPLVAPAALAYITMSLYYRVQSKLHTKEQVFVGVTFGALNGYLWYQFTHGFRPFSSIPSLNAIVSSTILPSSGVLPAQYLIVPAAIGLAVVGSLERRIPQWIISQRKNKKQR